MPFSMRPYRRLPVQWLVTSSGFGNRWVGGLVFLVLVTSGCSEWTIPPCAGTPFTMPCVGPCTTDVEPAGPTYTQVTMSSRRRDSGSVWEAALPSDPAMMFNVSAGLTRKRGLASL